MMPPPAYADDEPRKHVDAAARVGFIGSTGFWGYGFLFGAEAAYIVSRRGELAVISSGRA